MELIFRNDDINAYSKDEVDDLYYVISEKFPEAQIWSCFTIFSKHNQAGSVYPDVPFKDKPIKYFYDVDGIHYHPFDFYGSTPVSHGLWHLDHSKISKELQEASILTSCNLLQSNIFVPPFNHWNENTEIICKENNIRLVKSVEEGWRSLEHNPFDPSHNLWYFHSWRFTIDEFLEKINACPKL